MLRPQKYGTCQHGNNCIHIHDARRPLDDKLLTSKEDKEAEEDSRTHEDTEDNSPGEEDPEDSEEDSEDPESEEKHWQDRVNEACDDFLERRRCDPLSFDGRCPGCQKDFTRYRKFEKHVERCLRPDSDDSE